MVKVTRVERLGEYRLRLTFSDGVVGDIDLAAELWGEMFEPLRDHSVRPRPRGSGAGHTDVAQRCGPRSGRTSHHGATGTAGELTPLAPQWSRGLLIDPVAQRIARHAERATDADNGDGA